MLHFWKYKHAQKDGERDCNPRRVTWMFGKPTYVYCKAEGMESRRSQKPSGNYNQVVVHEATQTKIGDLELKWGDDLIKRLLRPMPPTKILSPWRFEQDE